MKLVLDTNVLIAAFAARGLCHSVLELCIDRHEVFLSGALLEELRTNLARKLKLPEDQSTQIEKFLREIGHVESPPQLSEPVCRDPDDDLILALAEAVSADMLITGDKDLLILERHAMTQILTPRDFWEKERAADR